MLPLKWHAYALANKLKSKRKKLVTAESCTGGMLATLLTSFSGSSNYFDSAFVTYSNNAKEKLLAVDPKILKTYGAVSEETAKAMSKGALKARNADLAVSITGIAGPKSDSTKKPVGLVYISLATKDSYFVKEFRFKGRRNKIRKLSCLNAMKIIASYL